MELKEGMYVRLSRNQGINRIEEYDEDFEKYTLENVVYDEWGDETFILDENDIVGKPSFRLITLVQVGDYVNGKRVNKIVHYEGDSFYRLELFGGKSIMNSNDIKSIVTKEQFELMVYKIEA